MTGLLWFLHIDTYDVGYKCTLLGIFMMAENATFLSVCAGESQAGNPIGSALVYI